MLPHTVFLSLGCLLSPVLAQTFVPLVRPFHVGNPAAFDSTRGRLVMFDGDGTTWELAGGELLPRANLDGSPTPPPRGGQGMCYDEARRRVLMFGGRNSPTSMLSDTWAYDGSRWSQLTTGPTPPARSPRAITWDSVRSRVLMWGGENPIYLDDTWEHDGTNWVQRLPATTPQASDGIMTFDRQRGVAVLVKSTGAPGPGTETWEWNGFDWALRTAAGAGPDDQSWSTLAFDSSRNRTVLTGSDPFNRIWEWDGTSWTASGPLPQQFQRSDAASWFDPSCGCITIAGGSDSSQRADQWQWNGQTLTQVQSDSGPRTAARATLVHDLVRARMLHFGGEPISPIAGETWAFAGGAWSAVPSLTSPSPRTRAAATYDVIRGESLLFGGFDGSVSLGDTWSIAGGGWVNLSNTGPAPRSGATMAFDLVRGVAVMFGGLVAGVGESSETWEWNGAVWTQRPTTVQPAARSNAAMAFHPGLGSILLFGGDAASSTVPFNDTWTWDGIQWTALAPATVPPQFPSASMHTNLVTTGCTLVLQSLLSRQVWSHDGIDWLQLLNEPAPLNSATFSCALGAMFDPLVCSGDGAMVTELTFVPGRVATLGAGCGTPVASLAVRSRPRVGTTTGFELVANPNRAVLFGLDLNSGNTPLGSGCTLWLTPTFLGLFQISDAAGFASQLLLLPANPTLRGLDLFAQAAVLEPQSSNGLVLTQGLRLTLGD